MQLILQWIDLIWLPLGWITVHKKQRWWAVSTLLACMAMMRMLTELMDTINHPDGIIHLISTPVSGRGMMVYSFFYAAYLLYAHFMRSEGVIFMAASLGMFFFAAVTFTVVMVL